MLNPSNLPIYRFYIIINQLIIVNQLKVEEGAQIKKIKLIFFLLLCIQLNLSANEDVDYYELLIQYIDNSDYESFKKCLDENSSEFQYIDQLIYDNNPLQYAIENDKYNFIIDLINAGFPKYYASFQDQEFSLIYNSILDNDNKMIDFLLKNGFGFDHGNSYYDFSQIIYNNNIKAAELFIHYGYELNRIIKYTGKDNGGGSWKREFSFLTLAIKEQKSDIAKLILKHSKNINFVRCAINRSQCGVDVYNYDIEIGTALDLAIENNMTDLIIQLKKAGAKTVKRIYNFKYPRFYSIVNGLRVRSEPNLDGKIIGALQENDKVAVVKSSKNYTKIENVGTFNWFKVKMADNTTGWVWSGFLRPVDKFF
jgi:ankyrin repeat protein